MDYKNFFVPQGNELVKIDQLLAPGEVYNFDISLKGDTMRAITLIQLLISLILILR